MDLWFLVAIGLGLNYLGHVLLHRRARSVDPDPSLRLSPDQEFWAGRPVGPGVRSARRQIFEESADPRIDHARRATISSFVLVVAWTFGGLLVAIPIQSSIGALWSIGPGFGLALASAFGIGLIWLIALADAASGPIANRRLIAASLLGILATAILIVVLPIIARA